MKSILSVTAAVIIAASSAVAAEMPEPSKRFAEMSKHYDKIVRIGVDVQGNQDDVSGDGDKKDMGYEIAFGAERKVDDFRFGTRIMNTIYNYGEKTYYEGGNKTYSNSNYGLEMSMSRFYKATQYFKPYLGLGFGINRSKTTYSDSNVMEERYAPTLHVVAGVSGELIVGIGYYVEAKRRFADNTNLIDGVDGTMTTAGVSYQF